MGDKNKVALAVELSRGIPMFFFLICLFVCLCEVILYVPVNNNGHVGTLPPFYGTFTQHKDGMTFKLCFINITTQVN